MDWDYNPPSAKQNNIMLSGEKKVIWNDKIEDQYMRISTQLT